MKAYISHFKLRNGLIGYCPVMAPEVLEASIIARDFIRQSYPNHTIADLQTKPSDNPLRVVDTRIVVTHRPFTQEDALQVQAEALRKWLPKLSPACAAALQAHLDEANRKLTLDCSGRCVAMEAQIREYIFNWTP